MKEINNQNPIRGFFGKLPIFNDFVKYNAGNQEIIGMDNWLQEGIILAKQKLKSDWKQVYKSSSPLNFFYPFTGTDKFISGVIFTGSDKSGREFPFFIYSVFKKDIIDNVPFYLIPLQFNNELNSFESIFNQIDVDTSLDDLTALINQVSSSFPDNNKNDRYQTFIDNTMQEDFWNRIYENYSEEKKYRLVDNIFNPEINNSRLPLRIKFNSAVEDNILYISLLLNILALSKDNIFLPALFWNINRDNITSLNIFSSHPAPINYLNMIYSNGNDDRIFALETKSGSALAQPINKDILNKKINLKELLQILNTI
ncbi:MAG: type VI secretion system-associated protein TagF [Ignavibacteriaceae bacterium]